VDGLKRRLVPIPEDIVEGLRDVARRIGISHYDLLAQLLYIYLGSSRLTDDLPGVALEAALVSYLKKYGVILVPVRVLNSVLKNEGREVDEVAGAVSVVARISTMALVEQGAIRDYSVVRSLFSSWLPGLPLTVSSDGDLWHVVVASPDIGGGVARIVAGIVRGVVEGLKGEVVWERIGDGVVSVKFKLPKGFVEAARE